MMGIINIPGASVDKIDASDWIKSNGAIYLKLQNTNRDSISSTNLARIIYNFHTGEKIIMSDLSLWRMWSKDLSTDSWISETEFDKIHSVLLH